MANLVIRDLVKTYDKTEVLHSISLEVEDGEFVVFVGPSGCGKSTTLRLVAGLEEVTAGTIEIGGRLVNNLEPKDRDIAMVFQNYAIYPHMTVRKNIGFGLRSSKASRPEKDKRLESVAELLGMTEYLDRKPSQLSGGQRQRVGSTIVFVTHDQVEAMTMADRIVIMKDGDIHQVGTPAEVYHKPANTFVAQFIGAPSMNMIPGTTKPGGVIELSTGGTLTFERTLPEGREIILGIRPEDLHPGQGTGVIEGSVNVREPLGHETLIYVGTSNGDVIAKADGRTPPEIGETVQLGADPENLHIFDAATGEALA